MLKDKLDRVNSLCLAV